MIPNLIPFAIMEQKMNRLPVLAAQEFAYEFFNAEPEPTCESGY